MTVDEVMEHVACGASDGYARVLADEVRRLQSELGPIDGGGICEICRERANIRADRYRRALNNIRTQIAAGTPTDLVWRLADNALRGGEE